MKKHLRHGIVGIVGALTAAAAFAQTGLTVMSGTGLFVKSGTAFSVDSLVLKPSADFTIAGVNSLQRSVTVANGIPGNYVRRVFRFSTSLTGYSGEIGVYCRDEDQNGLDESRLFLNIHDGMAWNAYASNVTHDAVNNFVNTTGLDKVTLGELTLAEGCAAKTTYYEDKDGDGFGNGAVTKEDCVQPDGFVNNGNDCDDNHPQINPDAAETCDGQDNNCDGQVDEGLTQNTYYRDSDGDGFGDPAAPAGFCSATPPLGYVANREDCDDTRKTYEDADGDGYGSITPVRCGVDNNADCHDTNANLNPDDFDGDGITSCAGDCNDQNKYIYPNAPELCDGTDNDCDGQIDDGLMIFTYNRDADGDGYGDPANSIRNCGAPHGYVNNALDCNDANAAVNPAEAELCGNGIDDNCNGQVDEGCGSLPTLSISNAQAYEATASVTLTVSLFKISPTDVKVAYTTVDGSAVSKGRGRNPAIDFVAKKGTLTIPAGQREGAITIVIIDDRTTEQQEMFTVQLSKPVNATIATGTGTVTINDGLPPATTNTKTKSAPKSDLPESLPVTSLAVTAQPNPSTQAFTLHISSGSDQPVSMVVTDMLGRVVEARSGMAANNPVRIGEGYRPGVYLLTLRQGTTRVFAKLVRQSH
jgi:hypothetical protein